MTVWIILSIIAVVLSPLVWLRPSRSQSGRMAMRMQARRMGLAMQLIPQEWPHWVPTEPPSPCPQYHRPRTARAPDVWVYWQMEAGLGGKPWLEAGVDPCPLELVKMLPADVYKVESGKQLIAVYWAERGEPEVLQHIAAVLKALA